jgi:hypothetical protein
MLMPTSAYDLRASGGGAEASDRRRPVPSYYLGLCGLGPPFLGGGGGCEAHGKGYPLGVLTTRVPSGPYLLWRTPSLSDVRAIMVIMCVFRVTLLCQAVA